jgi:hypothetical protein
MMRCRPGTVTHTAFATVPDQRCTASLSLALHRIRDTSHVILAPMGLTRGSTPGHLTRREPLNDSAATHIRTSNPPR